MGSIQLMYCVEFAIRGSHGKSKATAEKRDAFTRLLGADFAFRSLCNLPSALALPLFLISLSWQILVRRPKFIVYRGALAFLPAALCRLTRSVIVVECHASYRDEGRVLGLRGGRRLAMNLGEAFLSLSLRACHGAIFNNPRLERYYRSKVARLDGRTLVCHNGTDTAFFVNGDTLSAKAAIGIPGDSINLVFVGSQSVWHGTDRLVALARHLGTRDSGIVVLIAGGSSGVGSDHARREGNLIRLGGVSKETALSLIHSADVCLLPVNDCRISPGSPLKLFDYAACGKTILTQRDIEGYSDVVLDRGIGHCVDFSDPSAAADLIVELASRGALILDGKSIRGTAERFFDWSAIARAWMEFLQRLDRPR